MTAARRRVAAGALLLLSCAGASATALCRWVDERGRTQIAAEAPAQYAQTAVCTDSQRYELSPGQREAAAQRVADDLAQARRAAASAPAPGAASAPAAPASRSRAKRPAEPVTAATDCPTRWRLYDESVECFGPFRTTRGATKVEAFDHCNVIASPEARCGPRTR